MKIRLIAPALIAALAVSAAPILPGGAALAIPVFDASNYAQNVLTAARTLQQINQQIQQLQNEAQMLSNMARNLTRLDVPQLQDLRQRLQEIDRLMGEARGIDLRVEGLEQRLRELFPDSFDALLGRDQRVARARAQLDAAMSAFRRTMGVQSGIAENVRTDAEALARIVAASQSAEGSLQAAQTTNQLLALGARQQFQIQQLLASQFQVEAIEQARRGQIEREARETTRRFLGDGRAYTPRP